MSDAELQQLHQHAERLFEAGPGVLFLYGAPGIGKFRRASTIARALLGRQDERLRPLELRMTSWGDDPTRYALLELLRELDAGLSRPWDMSNHQLRDVYYDLTRRPTVLLLDEVDQWGGVKDFLLPDSPHSLIIASGGRPLSQEDLERGGLDPGQVHQALVRGPDRAKSRRIFAATACRAATTPEEKADVHRLIDLCENRPLALKLAAGIYRRGASRNLTARDIIDRVLPDTGADVAVQLLHWVYRHLSDDERELFHLLSLTTRPAVGPHSGITVQSLRRGGRERPAPVEADAMGDQGLRALTSLGLLEPGAERRYRVSPTVQRFAHDRLAERERLDPSDQNLAEAFRRFVATTPALPWIPLEKGALAQIVAPPPDGKNLEMSVRVMAADLCDHLVQQRESLVLAMFLYVVEQFADDVRRVLELAVHSALGVLDRKSGHLDEARDRLTWVRGQYAAASCRLLEVRTLRQIGVAYYHAGELRIAVHYLRRAADMVAGQHDEHVRERESPWISRVLGTAYIDLGRLEEARGLLTETAELHEEHGNLLGGAWTRTFLANCLLQMHDPQRAKVELDRAQKVFTAYTPRLSFARAWAYLARGRQMWQEPGKQQQALERMRRSRELSRRLHEPLGSAYAELELGRCKRELGRLDAARQSLQSARREFEEMGNRLGRAWASYELALIPDGLSPAALLLDEAAGAFELCGDRPALLLTRRQLKRLADKERLDTTDTRAGAEPIADTACLVSVDLVAADGPPGPGTRARTARLCVSVYPELAVQEALAESAHPECRVLAMAPNATVEPGASSIDPRRDAWPMQATFEVRREEPGVEPVRFIVLNEAAGTLLQDVEVTLNMK
ncbi:hypothetical protein ACIRF8_06125 [Streptomyces sp. NPDC102406]|uniref:hypothetical protein n=1 Tax=Streptomyces sp. NPDC102406 TaxID=3366171 RepID=UPI00381543CE